MTIRQSDGAIKPNDISGDVAIRDGVNLVIRLRSQSTGVKFREVKFDLDELVLPYTVIDWMPPQGRMLWFIQ